MRDRAVQKSWCCLALDNFISRGIVEHLFWKVLFCFVVVYLLITCSPSWDLLNKSYNRTNLKSGVIKHHRQPCTLRPTVRSKRTSTLAVDVPEYNSSQRMIYERGKNSSKTCREMEEWMCPVKLSAVIHYKSYRSTCKTKRSLFPHRTFPIECQI